MTHRLVAALALTQALTSGPAAPGHATLCLDPSGINLGATCQSYSASLVERRPDICQCLNIGVPVTAPYCRPGERPQAEGAAYDRARAAASRADGTLIGKTYKGRSYCVAP